MSYEDFVYFILSEEDKSTDASLDYWFRCGWVCFGGRAARVRKVGRKGTRLPGLWLSCVGGCGCGGDEDREG